MLDLKEWIEIQLHNAASTKRQTEFLEAEKSDIDLENTINFLPTGENQNG